MGTEGEPTAKKQTKAERTHHVKMTIPMINKLGALGGT